MGMLEGCGVGWETGLCWLLRSAGGWEVENSKYMGRLRLMACTDPEVRLEEGVLICEFVSPFTVNTVQRSSPSRGHWQSRYYEVVESPMEHAEMPRTEW